MKRLLCWFGFHRVEWRWFWVIGPGGMSPTNLQYGRCECCGELCERDAKESQDGNSTSDW